MLTPDSNSRRLAIGLLWHSLSSGNLGVGALTESHLAILTATAEALGLRCDFLIIGTGTGLPPALAAELDARGHGLQIAPARLLRRDFAVLARACDVVFDIGEGDSFATIYGFKRFFYYWLSKNRVRNAGVPLVLAPQTIGPFDGALARWMASQVMARCNHVFARDTLSRGYLHDLGLDAVSGEATDLAFALPFKPMSHGSAAVTRVGINISGLLFGGGYTGGNQFGLSIDYAAAMRQIVQRFAAMPGVEVHLVSHVITPGRPVEDDLAAAQTVARATPSAVIAPAFERPGEAKSYIAGLDFFVGARMHACIAALSAGVPVVPMAYSRKFAGLFGSLGYHRTLDCKTTSVDKLLTDVLAAFEDRQVLAQEAALALTQIQQRLDAYQSCVGTAMRSAVAAWGPPR